MSLNPPPLPPIQPEWGAFQVWWQQVITDLGAAITDLADQVAAIAAAQAAADAAQTSADTAQTSADTVKRDDAISASWTSPGSILTAVGAGSDATITIANHTRKYGDGTSLAITGADITGLAFSTKYYVYYNDSTRADTTPSFQAATNPNTALPNAGTGRHYCGTVTTPADGGGGTSGGYTPPGGFGGPGEIP